MKCEKCKKEHDGSYGSGRFCSQSCANSFSTLYDNKKETKNAKCVVCGKIYKINKRRSHKNFICDSCIIKPLPKELNRVKKIKCKACGKIIKKNISGYCRKCYYTASILKDTRKKLSDKAKEREFWKLKRKQIVEYNGFKFDSSYEVSVAKSLDENNIKWEKPNSFRYTYKRKEHTYTPDFYLLDFDVYLDPKNDFLINCVNPGTGYKDTTKIKKVEEQNDIRVIILDKNHLSWEKIKELI